MSPPPKKYRKVTLRLFEDDCLFVESRHALLGMNKVVRAILHNHIRRVKELESVALAEEGLLRNEPTDPDDE